MKLKTLLLASFELKICFARLHFDKEKIVKGPETSVPFRGRSSVGRCFKIPSRKIIKALDPLMKI